MEPYMVLRDIERNNPIAAIPLSGTETYYFGRIDEVLLLRKAGLLGVEVRKQESQELRETELFNGYAFKVGGGHKPLKSKNVASFGELSVVVEMYDEPEGVFEHVGDLHGFIHVSDGKPHVYDLSVYEIPQGNQLGSRAGTLIHRVRERNEEFHTMLGGRVGLYEQTESGLQRRPRTTVEGASFPNVELQDQDIVFLGYTIPTEEVESGKVTYFDLLKETHKRRLFLGIRVTFTDTTQDRSIAPELSVLEVYRPKLMGVPLENH